MKIKSNRGSDKKIIIAWVFPKLMSIYGDYGNVLTLKRRLTWRGFPCGIVEIDETNSKELGSADIIVMGGGQDRQQALCALDLLKKKRPYLEEAHEKGVPGLFACGGYQLMGYFYHPLSGHELKEFDPDAFAEKMGSLKFVPGEGADLPGLKIFDQYTIHYGKHKPRCIGNVVSDLHPQMKQNLALIYPNHYPTLVGFENHGGRTYLMPHKKYTPRQSIPLGKVLLGWGNNGEDKTEGILSHHFVGTYLHGFLIKNPHIADFLILKALKNKFNVETLEPLDDRLEWEAHKHVINSHQKKE